MNEIIYTDTPTDKTVKPTQTPFTNNTDKSIILNFQQGDTDIPVGETKSIIKKIISIKYNATIYYSTHPNDYTIPQGKTATLSKSKTNIKMTIT